MLNVINQTFSYIGCKFYFAVKSRQQLKTKHNWTQFRIEKEIVKRKMETNSTEMNSTGNGTIGGGISSNQDEQIMLQKQVNQTLGVSRNTLPSG